MAKQPDDWLDDIPAPQDEEDEEIIWVSKAKLNAMLRSSKS